MSYYIFEHVLHQASLANHESCWMSLAAHGGRAVNCAEMGRGGGGSPSPLRSLLFNLCSQQIEQRSIHSIAQRKGRRSGGLWRGKDQVTDEDGRKETKRSGGAEDAK